MTVAELIRILENVKEKTRKVTLGEIGRNSDFIGCEIREIDEWVTEVFIDFKP